MFHIIPVLLCKSVNIYILYIFFLHYIFSNCLVLDPMDVGVTDCIDTQSITMLNQIHSLRSQSEGALQV